MTTTTRRTNFLQLALFAVPLLAASGCTIYDHDGWGGECTFGCPGYACTQTADCHSSCACNQGTCETQSTCTTASDCGADESCVQGVCLPFCTKNGDCHSGQFCLAGTCRVVPSGSKMCTSSTQCGLDPCINGYCVRPCTLDLDCSTGMTCQDGFCGTTSSTPADAGTGGRGG